MPSLKKIIIVFGFFSSINVCYSQQERMEERLIAPKPRQEGHSEYFVGLIGGVNSPVSSDIASSAEGGVSLAYQPGGALGLGAEVTTSELKDADRSQRVTTLIQTAYRVGGDIPIIRGSYLGVGAGPTYLDSKLEMAVAPMIGFDIPLSSQVHDIVSLGLNAKYIGINNSPDSYVGNAAIKYWY